MRNDISAVITEFFTSMDSDFTQLREWSRFNADMNNPQLSFDEWKAKRPVSTNPATNAWEA